MDEIGQTERKTQNRVIKLFTDELGYTYLGNWQYRENNSNIIETDVETHGRASRWPCVSLP
jgi:type I restriction enzyme R subunit